MSVFFPLLLRHISYFLSSHCSHKVHTYLEYHTVPSSELGPPIPSPASECLLPPPPQSKEGEHPRLRVRGWGIPNSDDWRKSLAIQFCLLCDCPPSFSLQVIFRELIWIISLQMSSANKIYLSFDVFTGNWVILTWWCLHLGKPMFLSSSSTYCQILWNSMSKNLTKSKRWYW